MKIFRPEEFGAIADGIHNDATALWSAITAACEYKGEAQVLLQADKAYHIAPTDEQKSGKLQMKIGGVKQYASSMNCTAAIPIADAKDVHIKGKNTKILLSPPFNYCNIYHSENISVEGLVFDYAYHPFAKATLVELDEENRKAIIKCDRSLRIKERTLDRGFSVIERPDSRYHMRSLAFTPVDAENFIYEVEFKDDAATVERLPILREYPLIVPVPNFGHCIERGFSIVGNKNVSFKDCTIHSLARFGVVLFYNDGLVSFENFRAERTADEPACIVGWRDLFHVKESHAKYVWKNCYAEYCYDDIFNISASTLAVQKVYEEDDIDFIWPETKGVYGGVRVGDTVSIIDYATGKDYGEYKIREIVEQQGSHNRYRFKTPVVGIENAKNTRVHVLDMGAPGSLIEDCEFHGTFRLRNPIEVKNTFFENKRFWLDTWFPNAIGEGPVPKHIHFKDCTFVCDDEESKYFHIESHRAGNDGEPQYHIEDIVFENCKMPTDTLEIADSDRDYVIFK